MTKEKLYGLAAMVAACESRGEMPPPLSYPEFSELLRSARLALKAREWLVEHSDITGVALAGAEEAPHIKADRSALRALEALRKEFGLNG